MSSSPTSRFPRPAEFGRPRYPDEPFAPRPPTVRYGTEQPRPMSHDVGAIVRIRDEHMSNGMSGNRYDMGSRELGHPRGIATGGGGPQSLKDTKPTSGAAANGPKERTPTEEVLLQTCAYELKGMMCPIKGGCRKKKICLVRQFYFLFSLLPPSRILPLYYPSPSPIIHIPTSLFYAALAPTPVPIPYLLFLCQTNLNTN